jgi:branched-chain amino acid transport system ATP-binding protein
VVSAERGCAVVLVEHNVPFVMEHSHQITVLDLGRVIADGSPAEVRQADAVRAAYFE